MAKLKLEDLRRELNEKVGQYKKPEMDPLVSWINETNWRGKKGLDDMLKFNGEMFDINAEFDKCKIPDLLKVYNWVFKKNLIADDVEQSGFFTRIFG